MAKIEIEESELGALQQVNGVARALLGNPKTRQSFLRLQKELKPDLVIPELDAADGVRTEVAAVREEVTNFMKEFREMKEKETEDRRTSTFTAKIEAGRKLLADSGYNAEGIDKIEKVMEEEGIVSYKAGLALFERLNPPASPSESSRNHRWGDQLPADQSDDSWKQLWESKGDPGAIDAWTDAQVATQLRQFRN